MPVLAAAIALQLGAASAVVLTRSAPAAPPPSAALLPALGGLRPPPPAAPLRRTTAQRVRPAALELTAPLVPLGVDRKGELEVPRTATDVGRWTGGVVPGDVGTAVLVGHVDLDGVPGVFARLRELRPGARVVVRRDDGRAVDFVVDRVEQHPKRAFPTEAVYAPADVPALRLVTCGGGFDERTGHYRDNVVVFATAV